MIGLIYTRTIAIHPRTVSENSVEKGRLKLIVLLWECSTELETKSSFAFNVVVQAGGKQLQRVVAGSPLKVGSS